MPRSVIAPLSGIDTESLVNTCRPTMAGRRASKEKLNGQVYTPLDLARKMLEMVRWPMGDEDGVLLDPSCGDGVFLQAAMMKVVDLGLPRTRTRRIIEERLVGWDLDPKALAACRARLERFIEGAGGDLELPRLEKRNTLVPRDGERFECVAGNPPYLESKRMPDELKRLVRETCPAAARGGFDLYSAFIERALELTLAASSEICLIIPNRFLVASYADELRRRLLSSRELTVLDLSQLRVFDDAAVYPIVIHARIPETTRRPSYTVLKSAGSKSRVCLPSSILLDHLSGVMPIAPGHPGGRTLIARVLSDESFVPLSSLLEIRWTVSFHRAGLRDRFVFPSEKRGLQSPMPFLGGGRFHGNRELEAYRIRWAGSWIDYDEERAREEKNPLPPRRLFESPKLVICQNARRARVAIDREGLVLKDTFLAGLPRDPKGAKGLLEWPAIVLNSDLFHYLYEHIYAGTRKSGGYLHYLPRYLSPLPVPRPLDLRKAQALHEVLESSTEAAEILAARAEAEKLVAAAYDLSEKERAAVASYPMPRH